MRGKPKGLAGCEIRKLGAASHGLALPENQHSAGHGPALPGHKKAPTEAGAFLQLVPETGVEPATYALRMRRSTN